MKGIVFSRVLSSSFTDKFYKIKLNWNISAKLTIFRILFFIENVDHMSFHLNSKNYDLKFYEIKPENSTN